MTDKITLLRGDHKVTYHKDPTRFAVRPSGSRARDAFDNAENMTALTADVRHVGSLPEQNFEMYAVKENDQLEETMDALREGSENDVVTHVYSLNDSPGSLLVPTGALTVQFRASVSLADRSAVLGEFGLAVDNAIPFLPHGYTVHLTEAATENPLKIAAQLLERPEIITAEPDMSFQVDLKHTPADSLYRRQWHLNNRGDSWGLQAGADVKAEAAWAITRGSRQIVVCILDDGFDLDHPDLSGDGKIIAPWNFAENNDDPRPAQPDDNHGTACAGVAVAEENGQGVVGLAPGCALMPVRMAAWLSDQSVAGMFQYAANHGADVISCSWSAEAWYFPLSSLIHAAIHDAALHGRSNGKGCVILFAAGNENRQLDGRKDGQRSYQGFALHPDVLAVGASTSLDRRAGYSNYGPELDLCAPSSGIQRIVTTDRLGSSGYAAGDYTYDFGGTSSATPLAAGLAALVLSAYPDLTSAAVRRILCETADPIDPQNGAYQDGRSPWYGCGRINASRAVVRPREANQDLQAPELLLEHRPYRPIPSAGILEDILTCGLDAAIRELGLILEVRHTYHGDLHIDLIPPHGEPIRMFSAPGESGHGLSRSYHSDSDPGLFNHLIGTSAFGDWRLSIEDRTPAHSGVLVCWSLTITY